MSSPRKEPQKNIKSALNQTKSDNKEIRRQSQMVREESDLNARIKFLENQSLLIPQIQSQLKIQEQQIQILMNDNDLFRKIQQRLLDDTIRLKEQITPIIDMNFLKNFLDQLESTVTGVVTQQQLKLYTLEEDIKKLSKQFGIDKNSNIQTPQCQTARDLQHEKLNTQLELLKIKQDSQNLVDSLQIYNRLGLPNHNHSVHSSNSNRISLHRPPEQSIESSRKLSESSQNQKQNKPQPLNLKYLKEKQITNRQTEEGQLSSKGDDSLLIPVWYQMMDQTKVQIQQPPPDSTTSRDTSRRGSIANKLMPQSQKNSHNKTSSFDDMFGSTDTKKKAITTTTIAEKLRKQSQRQDTVPSNSELQQSIQNTLRCLEAHTSWSLYGGGPQKREQKSRNSQK